VTVDGALQTPSQGLAHEVVTEAQRLVDVVARLRDELVHLTLQPEQLPEQFVRGLLVEPQLTAVDLVAYLSQALGHRRQPSRGALRELVGGQGRRLWWRGRRRATTRDAGFRHDVPLIGGRCGE